MLEVQYLSIGQIGEDFQQVQIQADKNQNLAF